MAPRKILLDSSYLYVLFKRNDSKYESAVEVADLYRGSFIVSEVTLTEVAFLFNREGGVPAVVKFMDQLVRLQAQMEPLTYPDLMRAR
jgi:predicted nucleic acid-binding protein